MTNDMIWASYSDQLPGILLITEFFVVFAITVFPLVSAITFVQGLLAHRRGRDTWWQRRILLLAGLLAASAAVFGFCVNAQYALHYAGLDGILTYGGKPARLSGYVALIRYGATMLGLGTLASAFCFALALFQSDRRKP